MCRDLDAFESAVGNPVSLSRGYQSQSGARSGGRNRLQRKSTLQLLLEQDETSHHATTGVPLTERGNEIGGGFGCGPGSWSGHSSLSHSTGATFEPFSEHPEYNVQAGDE